MRFAIKRKTATAIKGTVLLTGCGGCRDCKGEGHRMAHGVMNEASPYIGYIEFLSSGACRQNGYYVTIEFTEDANGNLTGTVTGRIVSPTGTLSSLDNKYHGPLNAHLTGKRENGHVTFELCGDIQGTCGGTLTHSSGLSKIIGNPDV